MLVITIDWLGPPGPSRSIWTLSHRVQQNEARRCAACIMQVLVAPTETRPGYVLWWESGKSAGTNLFRMPTCQSITC